MKVLVCCLFIIVNISNNGKASLESLAPTGSNVLLEDITRNSDQSCHRPCKFNVKPRRCYYNFKIEPTLQENGRTAITVNGITPGPPINVCVNDIVVVEVRNKIPDQDLAIHWHGLEQRDTPYMDGVPMVTQCPIAYGSIYKYAFKASSPGTFFYHADSVSHQSDGVYGSLMINQPQPLEPHSSLYDYDRSNEYTLIIAPRFPQLFTGSLEDLTLLKPTNLVVNGEEEYSKLYVMQGFAYRLRLINAAAVECPVVVTIDNHEVMVIATDGRPVKPMAARTVRLYPGERMDLVVRAVQESGGYWIRIHGGNSCAGLATNAMLIYSGFNYTSMLDNAQIDVPAESEPLAYGQTLESLQDITQATEAKPVYLSIDRNVVKFKDSDLDFRYISDAIPKKQFFPASLSLQEKGVVQINNKSFLYPNAPLLFTPNDLRKDMLCKVEDELKNRETQCVQILNAEKGDVIELVLVNEGFGSNDSYTFHLHGLNMQIVATWQDPNNKPISTEEFRKLDTDEKIVRNLRNPPSKDTITVPNKGYVISRVRIDRGGAWLLECRSCALSSLPTAVVINVPQSLPKQVLDTLPKCGSYRPPDVLLN